MAVQSYVITFDGYWRAVNTGGIPDKSGIYCVYACFYSAEKRKVKLVNLIYIGESANVRARIANHERYEDWNNYLEVGQELCFSFGPVVSSDRIRCEAAMIIERKPPANTEYANDFPFDQTRINLAGEIGLLNQNFTVYRT